MIELNVCVIIILAIYNITYIPYIHGPVLIMIYMGIGSTPPTL
jgi:hypothetical protein